MKRTFRFLILLCVMLIPLGCSNDNPSSPETEKQPDPVQEVELMISAAASLTDALDEMKPLFESEHPDVSLKFNFGSSGKLAQMITQGAPADVFLSASEKDMNTLQDNNLIIEETRSHFTENELVLITNKENPVSLTSFEEIDAATVEHFSIGEPESVPVGRYTKEMLEHLGLWTSLQNNLVFGSDVRQVLTHVEMGNTEIGVVYASDAQISPKVKVIATADADWHEPIVYPGAVVSESLHVEEAKQFLTFLTGDEGKTILQKYGFK